MTFVGNVTRMFFLLAFKTVALTIYLNYYLGVAVLVPITMSASYNIFIYIY